MDYLRKYQRNIIILIAASLVVASGLVFMISIHQMSDTRREDAEQIISLLCTENAKEMNAHFSNVEETVGTLRYYALEKIKKGEDLTNEENIRKLLDDVRMMSIGAADNAEQAFEPFTQELSDGRTTYKGTGLGLAIVKKMIEGMGGSIRLISQKNVGTVFEITLDFEINENPSETKSAEDEMKDCSGLKVLLVEDNDLNYEIANYLLEDAGVIVSGVRNGREAVDDFAKHPAGTYDAILMDIMMPVLGGIEATKEIRAMDRADAKEIPIIAMTANAFLEDEKKCKDAGMNAHLAKPLDMKKVFETLSGCVEGKNQGLSEI